MCFIIPLPIIKKWLQRWHHMSQHVGKKLYKIWFLITEIKDKKMWFFQGTFYKNPPCYINSFQNNPWEHQILSSDDSLCSTISPDSNFIEDSRIFVTHSPSSQQVWKVHQWKVLRRGGARRFEVTRRQRLVVLEGIKGALPGTMEIRHRLRLTYRTVSGNLLYLHIRLV